MLNDFIDLFPCVCSIRVTGTVQHFSNQTYILNLFKYNNCHPSKLFFIHTCSCIVVDPQCKNVKIQNIKVQANTIPGKTPSTENQWMMNMLLII